jgi:hypothetical protein
MSLGGIVQSRRVSRNPGGNFRARNTAPKTIPTSRHCGTAFGRQSHLVSIGSRSFLGFEAAQSCECADSFGENPRSHMSLRVTFARPQPQLARCHSLNSHLRLSLHHCNNGLLCNVATYLSGCRPSGSSQKTHKYLVHLITR